MGMRSVLMGDGLWTAWVTAVLALALGAALLSTVMARSLQRDSLRPRARRTRFEVLGWSTLACAGLVTAAWPALTVFHRVTVEADGSWRLHNALGMPLGVIARDAPRTLEGEDLGGLRFGAGRVRIVLGDGREYRSVRVSGVRFERALESLGYPAAVRFDVAGSIRVPAHRYDAAGPTLLASAP
jgi:hypothetical protein